RGPTPPRPERRAARRYRRATACRRQCGPWRALGRGCSAWDRGVSSRTAFDGCHHESFSSVKSAGSVEDALRTIQWLRPDVVVSDISMPGEDGYALVRKLRVFERGRSAIPAIALTAHARPEDTEQAFVAGFAEHLAKPVDAPELVRAIARVTRRA